MRLERSIYQCTFDNKITLVEILMTLKIHCIRFDRFTKDFHLSHIENETSSLFLQLSYKFELLTCLKCFQRTWHCSDDRVWYAFGLLKKELT